MGYAYTAKVDDADDVEVPTPPADDPVFPTVWPPDFPIPDDPAPDGEDEPYPPGWPQDVEGDGYTLVVDVGATITAESLEGVSLLAYIQKAAADNGDMEGQLIRISAANGETPVQMRKGTADAWADYIDFEVINYTGTKWGFNSSGVYINVSADDGGDTITVTGVVLGFVLLSTGEVGITDTDTCTVATDIDSFPGLVYKRSRTASKLFSDTAGLIPVGDGDNIKHWKNDVSDSTIYADDDGSGADWLWTEDAATIADDWLLGQTVDVTDPIMYHSTSGASGVGMTAYDPDDELQVCESLTLAVAGQFIYYDSGGTGGTVTLVGVVLSVGTGLKLTLSQNAAADTYTVTLVGTSCAYTGSNAGNLTIRIVATYDKLTNTAKLYINGTLQATDASVTAFDPANITGPVMVSWSQATAAALRFPAVELIYSEAMTTAQAAALDSALQNEL